MEIDRLKRAPFVLMGFVASIFLSLAFAFVIPMLGVNSLGFAYLLFAPALGGVLVHRVATGGDWWPRTPVAFIGFVGVMLLLFVSEFPAPSFLNFGFEAVGAVLMYVVHLVVDIRFSE